MHVFFGPRSLPFRSFVAFFSILCPFLYGDADFFHWQPSGEGSFTSFNNLYGPQNAALGGAGGALATPQPLAALVNPAAVQSSTDRYQAAVALEMGALYTSQALIALNYEWRGILWQPLFYLEKQSSMQGMNTDGYETDIKYTPQQNIMALSAIKTLSNIRFGSTLKWLRDHLSPESRDQDGMAIALDWGLWWQGSDPRYSLGFSVLNLGRQIRAYTQSGSNHQLLNTTLKLSSMWRFTHPRGLCLLMDADFPRYSPMNLHVGLEYPLTRWILLRGGANPLFSEIRYWMNPILPHDYDEPLKPSQQFYVGTALDLNGWVFEYALTRLRYNAGFRHQLGLRQSF